MSNEEVKNTNMGNLVKKKLAEPLRESPVTGLNLMPQMTAQEKVVEKAKSRFSIGSVLSLVLLVLISIGIVGFNIISKQVLNSKKEELYEYENVLEQKSDMIVSNNAILDRIILYKSVKNKTYSYKDIITFFNKIASKAGNIQIKNLDISESYAFELSGTAMSLESVSKLWYLLGTDPSIETINLESVGKTESNVNISFEGKLNMKNFVSE